MAKVIRKISRFAVGCSSKYFIQFSEMNCFANYKICVWCKQISEVKTQHRTMLFLEGLIEECGSYLEEDNFFSIVHQHLLKESRKYRLLRGKELNKIVSKYFLYYLKHRHLINIICSLNYSPLKREQVEKEFSLQ